jgi:threonine dehydratase
MSDLSSAIEQAQKIIYPQVRVTSLDPDRALSALTGCRVYLKCEHQQHTGSFKFRGATHKIAGLNAAARRDGVITASTGNHGQGVALAGRLAGVPTTVYVPASASAVKLDAMKALGAAVVTVPGDSLAAELAARRAAGETGKPFVSPYNDLDIVAGQGTLGLEILDQCPEVDAVFASVGGGGLIGGIGTAIKARKPAAQMVGCWPENAPSLHECLKAGRIIEVEERGTISDGTAGGVEPGSVTLPICQQVIDRAELVSEAAIKAAMKRLAETQHWIVEGAAGVALAGLLQAAPAYQGKTVVVVLCGRNIVFQRFMEAVQ